jgi:argininosuccinate lyase
MSQPIWAKNSATDSDPAINAFMSGEDALLDRQIIGFDIQASKVHAQGLARIGLISDADADTLVEGLTACAEALASGEFVLDERFEDGHSAIEHFLTERLGDLGKRIHTGRSRNDQVLVATRLFMLDRLEQLKNLCLEVAHAALHRAREAGLQPMPGYTHLQQAVFSSTGMWFAAWCEAFIDNARAAQDCAKQISANPLGTAAGYGVNLKLDRQFTTEALGFARMQINPIYTQNSRGKFEMASLQALQNALLDLRRLSWDLSLFTTQEFAFVDLPDRMTTGSSIMPNKRNPDLIELLRAAPATVLGAITELQQLLSLPSGYHRDLQDSKPPLLRGWNKGLQALSLLPGIIRDMQFKPDALNKHCQPEMHATDFAIEQAAAGVPFRDAYRETLERKEEWQARQPVDSLEARISPGGCGDLMLDELEGRLIRLSS